MAETQELTAEQRAKLWEQFVVEHGKAQEAYDASVRALAGAGLAVTVSLGVALKELPATGVWAAALFLGALLLNLGSYVSVQLDMRERLGALRKHGATYEGAERSRWTRWTWLANVAAGVALLVAGVFLVAFIARST
jgi:uncharacterized membrane protein HdeD (DUF308 family)